MEGMEAEAMVEELMEEEVMAEEHMEEGGQCKIHPASSTSSSI